MQIFVKTDGRTLAVDVDPLSSVDCLLGHLNPIDNPFLQNGLLYYRGSPLSEEVTLQELEIEEGSTLDYVVGLQGGAKKRKKKNYTTPKKNKHKKKKVKLAVLRYYKVGLIEIRLTFPLLFNRCLNDVFYLKG